MSSAKYAAIILAVMFIALANKRLCPVVPWRNDGVYGRFESGGILCLQRCCSARFGQPRGRSDEIEQFIDKCHFIE